MDLGNLIAIGYGIVALIATRVAFGHLRNSWMEEFRGDFNGGDRAACGAMGFVIGLTWPFFLLGYLLTMKPPKSPWERREDKREREEYIRKLEKELGIHDR